MQRAPSGTLHLFYGTIRQLGHHNLGVSMRMFFTTTNTTGTTILSHGQSRISTDDTENYIITRTIADIHGRHMISNWKGTPRRGKRNLAQGRMSVANGTLGKMHPDGPRPARARGNVRNVFPYRTVNVPCCHFQGAGYGGWSDTQGAARYTRSALG